MNFGVLFFILIALFMLGSVYTIKVFAAPKNKGVVKNEQNQKNTSNSNQ